MSLNFLSPLQSKVIAFSDTSISQTHLLKLQGMCSTNSIIISFHDLIIQASSMSNWCKFDSLLLIWEFGFILGGFSFKRKDVKVVIGKGVRCSAQPSPPPAWPGTALVDPGTKNWNGPKPISIVGSTGSIGTQVNFIKHLAGVEKMHIIWWFLALICVVL